MHFSELCLFCLSFSLYTPFISTSFLIDFWRFIIYLNISFNQGICEKLNECINLNAGIQSCSDPINQIIILLLISALVNAQSWIKPWIYPSTKIQKSLIKETMSPTIISDFLLLYISLQYWDIIDEQVYYFIFDQTCSIISTTYVALIQFCLYVFKILFFQCILIWEFSFHIIDKGNMRKNYC